MTEVGEPERGGVRISVDHNKCVGSQLCVQIAPAVFALDEKRQSTVVNPAGDTDAQIVEAAEQCPMEAITVGDAETGSILFP